ncbi:MAG: FG-GAP-like repeat-containing protein [Terriglobales bacterium]
MRILFCARVSCAVLTVLVLILTFLFATQTDCQAQSPGIDRENIANRSNAFLLGPQAQQKTKSGPPMRFRGWKYGANNPEYVKRFARRRAGLVLPIPQQPEGRQLQQLSARSAGVGPSVNMPWVQPRPSIPAGYIPVSVATADFNGDGNIDWVVCNAGDNNLWIYLGDGHGGWKLPVILPVVGLVPVWVVTGDFRGNEKQDIVVAEADSSSVGVFLGNGDGTFATEQRYFLPDAPISLAVGDFNHDGKLDIMAGLAPTNNYDALAVLPGLGGGRFGAPLISHTTPMFTFPVVGWISVGDLNNDGILDAVVELIGGIVTFLGNGNGTFTEGQVIEEPYIITFTAAAVGDINEDGCADVVVLDTFAHAITFTGNCDGTVTQQNQYTIGDVGISIALADVNKDGHLDIVTGSILTEYGLGPSAGNLVSVLLGEGHGNFGEAAVYRGDEPLVGFAVADLNGDGYPDVLSANQDSDTATIFLNDGQGGYGAPNGYALGHGTGALNPLASGLLLGDLNGDGKKDLVLMEIPQTDQNLQLVTLLAQGNGKFAGPAYYPVAPATYYLQGDFALGDFRNTGHPDFVAIGGLYAPQSNVPYFLSFLPNNGDGTFGPAVLTNPPTAQGIMAVGDFNRDGKLDFVAIGPSSSGASLNMFLGNGDGTFPALPGVPINVEVAPSSVYAADLNKDGKLDVLIYFSGNVVPATADAVYEFLGNGDGTFQPPIQLFSNSDPLTLADVNGDGIPDLVTCKSPWASYPSLDQPPVITIYLGRGDGSFSQAHTYQPYSGDIELPSFGTANAGGGWCTVADFNGDGKPDIAVWQRPTGVFSDRYVQFLMGNGDGSFTPTYDLYRIHKGWVPQVATDVNGDELADLLEVDWETASFNYIAGGTAPPFQIGLLAEPVVSLGQLQISLNVPSASDTVFTLQPSEPGVQVPGSITIPAGAISQVVSFGFAKSFNPNHVFSITATDNGDSQTTFGALWNGEFATGIALSLVIPFQTTPAGGSTPNYGVSIGTVGGYTTTATLSCVGLPAHAQCVFNPTSYYLDPNDPNAGNGGLGSMIVSTDPSIVPGNYSFNVVAADAATSTSTPATLTVLAPEPDLAATASSSPPYPGVGTPFNITVLLVNNGYATATSTILTYSLSGPATVTSATTSQGTCSPSMCTLNAINVGAQAQIDFTVQPGAAGAVTFNAYATPTPPDMNPSNNGVTLTETVTDFSLSASPGSITVSPGQSAQFQATLAPVGGVFNNGITLTCSGATSGMQCTVPGGPFVISGNTVIENVTITSTKPQAIQEKMEVLLRHGPALFGLCLGFVVIGFRRRGWVTMISAIVLASCFACNGCGGGSSSGPGPGGGGTPPGTYNFTLTASSGSNQKTATLTVVVQ